MLVECLLLLEWRKIHDLSRSGEGDYLLSPMNQGDDISDQVD